MKLFAQHGAAEGDKINEAVATDLIDGVIYSPRDVSLETLRVKLAGWGKTDGQLERLFDPQYYASFLRGSEESRLGYLVDDYRPYLQPRRRSQLEREQQVRTDLASALEFQKHLDVTAIIAPNILIPRSLNSIEAAIAKNFVRMTRNEYAKLRDPRPIYATLAISRDALLSDREELIEFLNEITVLEEPPDGFYLLISARSTEARSDIYHADLIARWMLLNHVLGLNGFKIINGYSDILTPFLGAAGGTAGSLGWWSNLRTFSLDRFEPSHGGGRLPVQRYLSKRLLNRITFYELDALRQTNGSVLNGLPLDSLYDGDGSEPARNREVLQSWEAVKSLNQDLVSGEQIRDLDACSTAVEEAVAEYEQIPIPLDGKSNAEHLPPLADGITAFKKLAELGAA